MTKSLPVDHGLPGRLWSLRKLKHVVALVFATGCSRSTLCRRLHQVGLSWKKTKKILAKANTEKRKSYLAEFETLFLEMVRGQRTLIFIDEAHIHQDLDLGHGWAPCGRVFGIPSRSPGLHAKVNWYGAYDFTNGRVFLWAYPKCNGENTADFIERVAWWAEGLPNLTVIWDGSPVHRALVAQLRAREAGIEIKQLPAYSPDLNPIEGLWKWIREEVTGGFCHLSVEALFATCKAFVGHLNDRPLELVQRLWPRFELSPEVERLRKVG